MLLSKPNHLKALLIDMDGTIADTHVLLYSVYIAFLQDFDIEGTWEEFSLLMGPTLRTIVTKLKETYHLPDDIASLASRYQQQLHLQYEKGPPSFPGVREVLAYAKKWNLLNIIVTSASSSLVSLFLQNHLFTSLIDFIVTGDLVKQGKPDPALYLLALKMANIKASEAIAIEDSPAGVQSALTAGIPTLWIFNDSKNTEATPVKDWQEILGLLQSWYG